MYVGVIVLNCDDLSLPPTLPVLATHSVLSVMASNFIWLLAVSYYTYITFLGYTGTLLGLSFTNHCSLLHCVPTPYLM